MCGIVGPLFGNILFAVLHYRRGAPLLIIPLCFLFGLLLSFAYAYADYAIIVPVAMHVVYWHVTLGIFVKKKKVSEAFL